MLITQQIKTDLRARCWYWCLLAEAVDHTCCLAGATPILAPDMYEHSYHMNYGAKAAAYVDAFMNNINWENVLALYRNHAAYLNSCLTR